MAGFFADVPGVRIPYHVDGTSVRYATTTSNVSKTIISAWTNYTTEPAEMNDGDVTDVRIYSAPNGNNGRYIAWVFPQPIAVITGHNVLISYQGSGAGVGLLEYSSDTTDGGDGTWTTTASDNDLAATGSALRSISVVNWTNVKGIRLHMFSGGNGITHDARDIAFYGAWVPATLAGWHPTLDQQIPAAHLDLGDAGLASVITKQFRIKNGRTLQANNTVVSCALGNSQTSSGTQLSLDGSAYTNTVTIPTIAAGAISPVVYVRRTVGAAEAVGNVGVVPVQFIATTWT